MADWYPPAVRRELSYAKDMPKRRQAKTVCLHTNGGDPNLYGWFSRKGNTVASHFQVFKTGKVEQYIGVSRQAYAEVQGNDHCVSIETEDDGNPSTPWTHAQLAAIVGICQWLGVPAKIASETGDGVNWHALYADYNPHHHNCPGAVRIAQIKNAIIPSLRGDDMAGVMVPLPDNYPYKDHKPGDLVPIDKYLEIIGHQVFAIREVVQQDIAVDKQDAAAGAKQGK